MNKKKNNKTATVILASGTSDRFGGIIPKQYKKIKNKTVLEISINIFLKVNRISNLYVVYNSDHEKYVDAIKKKYNQIQFLKGGQTRQLSSLNAINFIYKKKIYKNILIHDAARPIIEKKMIKFLIDNLKSVDGVIPAIKITDSTKYVKNNFIFKNIERNNLYKAQTPQAFLIDKLKKAYDQFNKNELKHFTDDSEIFTTAGFKVKIIEGAQDNIKITSKNDFIRVKRKLMSNKEILKVGLGIDFHRFTKGNYLLLFGVKVPFIKSIKAHSDGDIGVHAVIDAILGTISSGDIGTYFPDTDKKFKNISSLILLKKILLILKKNNGKIIHIDNTIVCEKPKLQKYIFNMREAIAKVLEINIEAFSIKATTTEKMGYIGRGEGIAVHSIATINYGK